MNQNILWKNAGDLGEFSVKTARFCQKKKRCIYSNFPNNAPSALSHFYMYATMVQHWKERIVNSWVQGFHLICNMATFMTPHSWGVGGSQGGGHSGPPQMKFRTWTYKHKWGLHAKFQLSKSKHKKVHPLVYQIGIVSHPLLQFFSSLHFFGLCISFISLRYLKNYSRYANFEDGIGKLRSNRWW